MQLQYMGIECWLPARSEHLAGASAPSGPAATRGRADRASPAPAAGLPKVLPGRAGSPQLLPGLCPKQGRVVRAGQLELLAEVGALGILGAGNVVAGRRRGCGAMRRGVSQAGQWGELCGFSDCCRVHANSLQVVRSRAVTGQGQQGLPRALPSPTTPARAARHTAAQGGAAPPAVAALHQPAALDSCQHIAQRAMIRLKHLAGRQCKGVGSGMQDRMDRGSVPQKAKQQSGPGAKRWLGTVMHNAPTAHCLSEGCAHLWAPQCA